MKTELYIIIAVLFLLTIIMIWWGSRPFLICAKDKKHGRKDGNNPQYCAVRQQTDSKIRSLHKAPSIVFIP